MKHWFCFFSLLLFCTFACKKYKAGEALPPTQIHFGEGGGITGSITEYCLLTNGQLFDKQHFTENFKPFKKVKKTTAKQQFKTLKTINFDQIDLNNPGDKYYYIEYETEEGKHRITWGHNKQEVPKEITILYKSLKSLTKAVKE